MIGQMIVRCFHAATAAHALHPTTRSYATHKALRTKIIPGEDTCLPNIVGEIQALCGQAPYELCMLR